MKNIPEHVDTDFTAEQWQQIRLGNVMEVDTSIYTRQMLKMQRDKFFEKFRAEHK